MPEGNSDIPLKQKSRRGQTKRAVKSKNTGDKRKLCSKAIKTIPVVQGPVMRLSDGNLQAAIEKARPESTAEIDIKTARLIKNLAEQEEVTGAAVENLGAKDQSSKQEVECVPRVQKETATEIVGTLTEAGTQIELDSFDLVMNMVKQMVERSEVNKKEDIKTYAPFSEIDPSESLSGSAEKSREKERCDANAADHSVAHTPNIFAGIDVKTLESTDRFLNVFADSIDSLISSLEKTSLRQSQDMNKPKNINPDHSRWFRYRHNSINQHVELCQLVPQVVQSYPIQREKTTIARLNINGLHRCTAASGWDQPFQKNDIISNLTWTSQVEELCKIINHKLPHQKDLDYGFPGRYHACHAEKQLIAWYLYENTLAGHQVNTKLPNTLPYRELKASAPRGALIVVSRKICKDCKEFIEKVRKHFEISDHFHVESRTHLEDILDTEKTKKFLESCNNWKFY
ncbi:uncharacterized protein EAF02_006166 [Botrytis sinoallii]|uniref:uncharacterized protein n=1 Tax=Botrytis sinoallii TaxID=1463999 RepID=UPI0019008587|nr:uncharacterized protein EAF02_006166 [Botrytis sinoallii]KAF7882803.1 hypothetical protein EAF02_006166 [Botrytis sinoallii]